MICNKKEWEILDNVQHVLLNYYRTNTLKENVERETPTTLVPKGKGA